MIVASFFVGIFKKIKYVATENSIECTIRRGFLEKYKVVHIMADGNEIEDITSYAFPVAEDRTSEDIYLEQIFFNYWKKRMERDKEMLKNIPP